MPPLVGVALKVTDAPTQIDVEDAVMETDGVTKPVVIIIGVLVAVKGLAQAAVDVMITVTWSPLFKLFVINAGELVPAFTPFTCH